MKGKTLAVMGGLVALIILVSTKDVFAQTNTPLTGNEMLAKILSETNEIPLDLYPPGHLDWLKSLGDDLMPVAPIDEVIRPVRSEPIGSLISDNSMGRPGPSDPAPIYDYVIVDLGTLGGSSSVASAINNANNAQVAGWAYNGSGVNKPALFTSPVTDLGSAGGQALGINNSGKIVGSATPGSGLNQAFMWDGSIHYLGTLGGQQSAAFAINSSGDITGLGQISGDVAHAMLYSGGTMTDLGTFPSWSGTYLSIGYGIDDTGDIGGIMSTNSPNRAFLKADGTMTDIGTLGGSEAGVYAINSYAEVVGYSTTSGGAHHAMFYDYQNGTMEDLGVLSGTTSSDAYGINNNAHVVGSSGGTAFLVSGGSMKDLNTLVINSGSGWTLQYAYAINDKGQIVGSGLNPSSQMHGFLLNPLPLGWSGAITTTPSQPTYGNCVAKNSGKNNLVVVTHGWINRVFSPTSPADPSWIDGVSNVISGYLTSHSLGTWQVYGHRWVNAAWQVFPTHALNNARQEGKKLGDCIGSQGWSHVHLIAHSAGANLIQVATERIKALSPSTTVHCTFLDAYVGKHYEGVESYGDGADWADSYFSRDSSTRFGNLLTGPFTESSLDHAYNLDVTTLDPNKLVGITKFRSSVTGQMEPCYTTIASHSWPYEFYSNTITGNITPEYGGFGFPLSKEGGGWSTGVPNYTPGNNPAAILGTPDPTCSPNIQLMPPVWVDTLVDFIQAPTVESGTGTIQKWFDSIKLFSGSPAWLATVITTTNPVNTLSFSAHFTSATGAQGLFTVFWDDKVIGSIDERVVSSNKFTFAFPNAIANSPHILGFRLDPFTNIQSVVTVTNVILNQVGVSQPFSLIPTGSVTNGAPVYALTGETGFDYYIQASTNLTDWIDIAMLANTNGIVRFFDQSSTNRPIRFYRGVAPY